MLIYLTTPKGSNTKTNETTGPVNRLLYAAVCAALCWPDWSERTARQISNQTIQWFISIDATPVCTRVFMKYPFYFILIYYIARLYFDKFYLSKVAKIHLIADKNSNLNQIHPTVKIVVRKIEPFWFPGYCDIITTWLVLEPLSYQTFRLLTVLRKMQIHSGKWPRLTTQVSHEVVLLAANISVQLLPAAEKLNCVSFVV